MSSSQSHLETVVVEPRIGRSVSLDDAAVLLGVSRRTIYNRIREGRLQTVRTLGGSQRVLLGSMQEAQGGSPWNRPAAQPPLSAEQQLSRGTTTAS